MNGVMQFGKKGKLNPQYVGPYVIFMRFENVAYEFALSSSLNSIHLVFSVSMLRECVGDSSQLMPNKDIGTSDSLSYK